MCNADECVACVCTQRTRAILVIRPHLLLTGLRYAFRHVTSYVAVSHIAVSHVAVSHVGSGHVGNGDVGNGHVENGDVENGHIAVS